MRVSYSLVLPRGARFHPHGGALQDTVSFSLTGLVPFALPFHPSPLHDVRYRTLRLWLRHGLAPGVNPASFAACLTLTRTRDEGEEETERDDTPLPLRFSLVSAHSLQMEAELKPSTSYVLSVCEGSNISDGFQLPLLAGSTHFTTAPLEDLFLQPGGEFGSLQSLRFPTGPLPLPQAFPALVRGKHLCMDGLRHGCSEEHAQYSSYTPVHIEGVPAAIAALHNNNHLPVRISLPVTYRSS